MQEVIESIIGKEMTKSLMNIIDELIALEADEKEVYKNLKGFNDVSLLSMYLLSLKKKNNLSYYIKKAYQKKLDDRVYDFKKTKDYNKFLKKLDRIDVINLAYSLDLYNLSDNEVKKLSKTNQKYYKILNDYLNNMV
jgi:hypothetical protein